MGGRVAHAQSWADTVESMIRNGRRRQSTGNLRCCREFCTRLAIAGYDAFTIKALMGHRDMTTTERYIRAHRLTRQVALVEKNVHKLATNEWGEPLG